MVLSRVKPELMNPRAVLTMRAINKKVLHITQFLSEKAKKKLQKRRREVLLSTSDEVTGQDRLLVQSNEQHPYAGITIDEWGAANLRLLHHIIATSQLLVSKIEFYMAYTVSIFDFVPKYEWPSIMDFDYTYREQQAQLNFQWGEINSALEMQLLVPKQHTGYDRFNQHRRRTTRNPPNFNRNPGTPEECRQWKINRGYCPFGERCKYTHPDLPRNNLNPNQPPFQPKNGPTAWQGQAPPQVNRY